MSFGGQKIIGRIGLSQSLQLSRFCFVFVSLRPKSTVMVMAGPSVHLTTPFPGQA